MKKLFVMMTLVVFAVATTKINAQPPANKKLVEVDAKKVDKSRGTNMANPNIKSDAPTTDIAAKKPTKTRGTYCTVYLTNYTGYYVKVYLDGYYKGTLGPYESGEVTAYSGYKTVYCITTGGTYDWSAAGDCDGSYYFNLR